jgi:hypothetical protein
MSERISVCVPYWDRKQMLDDMFAMYARLYPHLPIEMSVCDDGTPLPAVVPDGVVLTRLKRKTIPLNPCVPINRAVAASTGDIIVLTNPEIQHTQPVLDEMLGLLEHEDDYVTARCRHHAPGKSTDGLWLAGPETDYNSNGREPLPPGAHFHFLAMFRRSLWSRAGGFDPDFRMGTACDDNDWCWRAYRAGARFRCTEGVVWHRRNKRTRWVMPHNAGLLRRNWPLDARRALIRKRQQVEVMA